MPVKAITCHDGRTFRFGRKRPTAQATKFKLKDYLGTALPPAPDCDYAAAAGEALGKIYENDTLGCHDAKTEVLTEKGWTLWPEYNGSDLLGTMSQETGMLEFQAPLALQRYEYDGPMHFADHKSLDFGLTPEHRMLHRPYFIPSPYFPGGGRYLDYQFGKISKLTHRVAIPATTTGFLGAELRSIRIGSRAWNGDDLIQLIALMLSDGFVSNAGKTWENIVSFFCFREDRYDMVATFAHRLGIAEQPGRKGVWKFTDGDLAAWMKSNCYTNSALGSTFKRVPDLVKVCSQRQIDTFFRYFGDQSISTDGVRSFYSGSRRMIDDLQEMLLRTGRRGGIYSRPQRDGIINGKEVKAIEGHVDITLTEWKDRKDSGVNLSLLSRNIAVDHYKGDVFCATVPNSTLVTRRNGRILISGNCCVISATAHMFGVLRENAGGNRSIFSDGEIIDQYSKCCGYIPGDPGSDAGCDVQQTLGQILSSGFKGHRKSNGEKVRMSHRIAGWLQVNGTNKEEVRQAIYLFENLVLGMELPDAWIEPFPAASGFQWDVAGPPDTANGHCVAVVGSNSTGIGISTWAMVGIMTYAAVAEYTAPRHGGELYVVLSEESINRAKEKSAAGFAWDQLETDFKSLGGVIS